MITNKKYFDLKASKLYTYFFFWLWNSRM